MMQKALVWFAAHLSTDIALITGPVTTQCRERMINVVSSARTKSYSIG